jgi:GTPase SAR1 family protein
MGPIYFRNCAAAFVVFDLTNQRTFTNLEHWITTFREAAEPNSRLIVVGNKCDLRRAIPLEDIKAWAREHKYSYVETSAKTGQGVKVLFDELIEAIVSADAQETIRPDIWVPNDEKSASSCC